MDFLTGIISKEQWIGLIAFFIGAAILNWCSKLERREFEVTRDPKEKWKYIDRSEEQEAFIKRKSMRGWLMTLAGAGAALYGFFTFLANIK